MSNPFMLESEMDSDNPFADPSVNQALTSNYTTVDARESVEIELSSASTSHDADKHYDGDLSNKKQPTNFDHLSKREEELKRREEELAQRERALRSEQDSMRQHGFHPPNWPFFYPYIYLDINEEIPEIHRGTVSKIYKFWLATVGNLLFNMLVCFILLVSPTANGGAQSPTVATDFGVALMYCFTITAASFFLWYRPIYNGYMKENSLYFRFATSGSAGFINLLGAFAAGKVFGGVMCIIDFAVWLTLGFVGLWTWKDVHHHYRAG
ncbi:hypothetical protein HK099_005635 [Clydaea vesicula]|uniref:Secretory carrier membrane protein n=1 Tax=Clydaea vesicula TaxID=447962 RepID=A0AAD5UA42_9FUNG|nr:hypothetical protein HK099_005635 [Clydaea vesicula]